MQIGRIKTRQEFIEKFRTVYDWLQKRKKLHLLHELLPRAQREPYTDEELIKDARKYNSRKEWETKSYNAYHAAQNRGILDECCEHMGRSRTGKTGTRKVKNLDTGKIYNSLSGAANDVGLKKGSPIRRAIKRNGKAGGYRWAYCDENGEVIDE